MPSGVTFKANRAGITALATGPKAVAAVVAKAEQAKAAAETLAQEHRRTGRYAASFEVTPTVVEIRGLPRAGAVLANTADYAAVVEVGREGQDGQHIISRAVDTLRA